MLKIYNTLSRSVEAFESIKPSQAGIYSCGPTVYDYMHIGNLRTFVFADLMERVLVFNGYKLKTVQNITDIDDKIIKRAKERGISISELSQEYEKYFLEDIKKLNIKPKDVVPHATEYVEKMQAYIQVLIDKELAYIEKDGSVYFDISKFDRYGKLSGIDASTLKTGTRSLSDEYTKEDIQDFALWKAELRDEVGYESAWGWGRPGWHIECSVMSQENLGDTLDLHMGGVDLIFPHHENEIAQSEGKTGKDFVRYFVHGAHMLVDGKKMSKSLGNFYKLSDLEQKNFDPMVLRYLYLQTHYRQEMNFTWEALEAAQTALNKLRAEFISWEEAKVGCAEFEQNFMDSVSTDLNIPKALSIVWEMIKSDYPSSAKKRSLLKMDEILGLNLAKFQPGRIEVSSEVQKLVEKREELRKAGDFKGADKVRSEIEERGFMIEDSDDGSKIVRKLDKS